MFPASRLGQMTEALVVLLLIWAFLIIWYLYIGPEITAAQDAFVRVFTHNIHATALTTVLTSP